jgi:hypothetical protein
MSQRAIEENLKWKEGARIRAQLKLKEKQQERVARRYSYFVVASVPFFKVDFFY